MVFKLNREAEDHWRRINGYDQIDKGIRGVPFKDGEEVLKAEEDEKEEPTTEKEGAA